MIYVFVILLRVHLKVASYSASTLYILYYIMSICQALYDNNSRAQFNYCVKIIYFTLKTRILLFIINLEKY